MSQHTFLVAVIACGLVGLLIVYRYLTRGTGSQRKRHRWLDYILLWPILLDADRDKRNGAFLTQREWVGWVIVALLIVLAVAFT